MIKKIHPSPPTPRNFEPAQILSCLRRHKANLQSKYGIHRFAVFGSYARGEQTSDSDIDILVELGDKPLGLAYFSMVREVAALFPLKTEVVSRDAIKKDLKDVWTEPRIAYCGHQGGYGKSRTFFRAKVGKTGILSSDETSAKA